MNIVIFEDHAAEQLRPASLLRPAYCITCGSLTLGGLAANLAPSVRHIVRPYLRPVADDFLPKTGKRDPEAPTLLLNARLVPDASAIERLAQQAKRGESFQSRKRGQLLTALLYGKASKQLEEVDYDSLDPFLTQITSDLCQVDSDLELLDHPFQVIMEHERVMAGNLDYRIRTGNYQEHASGVFVADDTVVPQQSVLDTTSGPIVLDRGAKVGPFSVLNGPIYVGAGAKISPHSLIKGPASLGHTTKVGGEVGYSIIEPYTNKSHFGYLGHAYVGRWINLGAGTSNSNLKNTYGSIRVQCGNEKIDTGRQFLGCVIGDFSKTAIQTGIFTGKVIGVCSNVYGLVTTDVPSFANYARIFGEVTAFPPEVMESTQKRVFLRRGIEQRPCDVELLRHVYQLERQSSELANTPPKL